MEHLGNLGFPFFFVFWVNYRQLYFSRFKLGRNSVHSTIAGHFLAQPWIWKQYAQNILKNICPETKCKPSCWKVVSKYNFKYKIALQNPEKKSVLSYKSTFLFWFYWPLLELLNHFYFYFVIVHSRLCLTAYVQRCYWNLFSLLNKN